MAKVPEDKYRKLVFCLAHTQIQLEAMDEAKGTVLYKHSAKRNLNILERDLEKILEGPFEQVYMEEEGNFRILSEHIEMITNWVAHASYEDIMDLGLALKNGQIKFED